MIGDIRKDPSFFIENRQMPHMFTKSIKEVKIYRFESVASVPVINVTL
jgi:hypothetical protein